MFIVLLKMQLFHVTMRIYFYKAVIRSSLRCLKRIPKVLPMIRSSFREDLEVRRLAVAVYGELSVIGRVVSVGGADG